ncbi:DUF3325 domain-containing protein [Shewanella sp. AS16]|uniref:DUF3325 domain-containing protein n=1 Tax=Shewanella sp. AS16 TaxID=2907625 RepID=UPI001F3DEF07|nr:DUF3325 domain-containing protein [Shewanella sp. AS16]MCE9686588.1 DUF3325 domain-containing protein [Shewanella sp. AS16]
MTGTSIAGAMMPALMGLSYLGLALLALAKFGHFREVFARAPSAAQSRGLSYAGSLLLATVFILCGQCFGWGYGSLVFLGLTSLGGFLCIMNLSFCARLMPGAMWVTGSVSALLALASY